MFRKPEGIGTCPRNKMTVAANWEEIMNPKSRILSLLRQRVLILDGAMGTELQKRGMPSGVCPEAWCLAHPEAVAEIHAAYREAGADIVYTSTFGANRLKMGQYNLTNVRETNRSLAEIAVRAAGGGLVAGDIGPTGHFVEPFGDVPFEDSVALFREQVQGLLEGGVDLFVIETMMDIQEARAALIAVREISDLFCMVTMTYEKHGRTLNGTDPVSALVTLQSLGADAVGCNCSAGPEGMLGLIAAMKPHAAVPLVAKPNAGLPKLVGDATVFDLDAAGFAGFGGPLAAAGVNLMGGCCGTTPAHIRALRDALTAVKPVAPAPSRCGRRKLGPEHRDPRRGKTPRDRRRTAERGGERGRTTGALERGSGTGPADGAGAGKGRGADSSAEGRRRRTR